MKKFQLIKSGLIATATLSALLAPLSAFAIPYNGATVYKAMDNGSTVVVFSATAGSKIQVNLGSSDKATARLAGSCGEIRISSPSSGSFAGLKVDGVAVDASTLPTQTLPSCLNGSFSEARSANFKTPNNQVVIVGKTAGSAVSISLPQPTTRSVTVNACGFGILKPSTGQTLPTSFSVDTTNYTLASLPDAGTSPYCRNLNGTFYGYIPASW
nr:hypothetical protein [Nostoc sp. EkiNYC01]